MIKSEVTACGLITRAAELKKTEKGETFIMFSMKLDLKGRDGSTYPLYISVTADGGESDIIQYKQGKKVTVLGNLHFRKKGDKLYFNLRADGGVELSDSGKEEKIEGKMEFKGKIGSKGVGSHLDKKNRTYKTFSAFSQSKDGENSEFLWFRFMFFNPKAEDVAILAAGKYVDIVGDLQLSSYNSKLSLDCRVSSVKEWVLKSNNKGQESEENN